MEISEHPWFSYMENYKATKSVLEDYTWQKKKHFYKEANHYLWDEPHVFKVSVDGLICICVTGKEVRDIMWNFYSLAYGGHHSGERTTSKILQNNF